MIGLKNILNGFGRQIRVHGSDIRLLDSPSCFRDTLLQLSSEISRRSRISALYVGSGNAEQQIVDNMVSGARRGADVALMIDRYRGTRDGGIVLKDLRMTAQVQLYQTPHLPWTKYQKPGVVGELLGVHHMKYYLFDDHVIISGANMSELYFGTRADRYMLIKSKQLADYICYFHDMQATSAKAWDAGNYAKSHWNKETFQVAGNVADNFSCNTPIDKGETRDLGPATADTSLFPLFQIPWSSIRQIDDVLDIILLTARRTQTITISSGYFNPTKRLLEAMKATKARVKIIVPSVEANGFYKGAFMKGMVPDLYNLAAVRTLQKCPNVEILEYQRNGWSFHSKGVWMDNLTILGSSNFNRRGSLRDSEFSLALVTENEQLLERLAAEKQGIKSFTSPLEEKHRFGTKALLPLLTRYL